MVGCSLCWGCALFEFGFSVGGVWVAITWIVLVRYYDSSGVIVEV